MPGALPHSPADILRAVLVDLDLGTDPDDDAAWPVFVGEEPSAPDNVVTLYDTDGRADGRDQVTGERQEHHGAQVRVRGVTHPAAYARARAIAVALDEDLYELVVTLGGEDYRVHCATRTGDVIQLRVDDPASRRTIFTVNTLLSLRLVFKPDHLEGLALWLKADGTLWQDSARATPASADGHPVGAWDDASGGGRHALQATSAARPALKLAVQNGLPVVRFDGANDRLFAATLAAPAVVTLFAAGRSTGAQGCLVAGDSGLNANLRQDIFALDGSNSVGSWSIATFAAVSGQRKSGDSKAWLNGVQSGSTSTVALGAMSANAVCVGERGLNDVFLQGDVGEVVVYTRELSTAERMLVDLYLRNRWGTP